MALIRLSSFRRGLRSKPVQPEWLDAIGSKLKAMQLLSLDAPPATRRRLQNLRQIADAVNATSDLNAVFERIVFAVCHHTGWWSSGIMAIARSGRRSPPALPGNRSRRAHPASGTG